MNRLIDRLHSPCRFILLWLAWAMVSGMAGAQTTNGTKPAVEHLMVSFPSTNGMMLGYLYRPAGEGPFPTIAFFHRDHSAVMNNSPKQLHDLTTFFTSKGFLLFMPDRHSDTFSNDEFSPALQRKLPNRLHDRSVNSQWIMERMEIVNRDIVASMRWLERHPDVDTNQIVMVGAFAGAMQSLISLERVNVKSVVLFSPATSSWKDALFLQGWLTGAVRNAKPPIFMAYLEDQNQAPIEVFTAELEKKGAPNQMKVYPPFGKVEEGGRSFIEKGVRIWGPDVAAFLEATGK